MFFVLSTANRQNVPLACLGCLANFHTSDYFAVYEVEGEITLALVFVCQHVSWFSLDPFQTYDFSLVSTRAFQVILRLWPQQQDILDKMISLKTVFSFFFGAILFQLSSGQSVKEKSQLESALQRGDIELATDLIRGGALENFPGPKNWEQIYSKLRIAKLLLSNHIAGVNTQDNDLEKGPCKKGEFDVVLIPGSSLITRMFINVTVVTNWGNKPIKNGRKPIHVISYLPDISPDIVQIVLENGNDDVNTKTDSQLTPLMLATHNGNLEVVKFLVERGARINEIAPVTVENNNLEGHFAFAKLISKNELYPIKSHLWSSALEFAIKRNNVDIVRYLLSKGADVNNKGLSWLGLFHAVYNGGIEILEILLRSGIGVNSKDQMGSTALHKAAETGRVEMAKMLLKKGARLNATDVLGWMPIHVASFFSKNGGKELIQLLVQSGSSIESVTDGGYSPLNLVEAGYNQNFLKFLVKNIDFMNQTKHYKDLPEADTNKMHVDIVESVIQLGAPLNHQDSVLGWSTLHWAAASGDLEVAKMLVKYGAVTSVRSNMGLNPFETATFFGRSKVAEFLRTAKDLV